MDEERVILTTDQALGYLPDGEFIHTFRSGGFLIGADWNRKDIVCAIENNEVELSGSMATAMNHGMTLIDNHGPLFIATKENFLNSDIIPDNDSIGDRYPEGEPGA